jgi:hypothetical protein
MYEETVQKFYRKNRKQGGSRVLAAAIFGTVTMERALNKQAVMNRT